MFLIKLIFIGVINICNVTITGEQDIQHNLNLERKNAPRKLAFEKSRSSLLTSRRSFKTTVIQSLKFIIFL